MTLLAFDATDASTENSGTSTMRTEQVEQIPAHPPEPDPLAAYVAGLTVEGRFKLLRLLEDEGRKAVAGQATERTTEVLMAE